MHKRPISSLSLPPATLGALTRAGFENVGDLTGFESAEALSTQLRIPIAQSQLVMSASQAIAPPTAASQSLASLSKAGVAQPRTTNCKELDNLLDGGLRPGRVYELSGPPGVPKDALALKIAASYARTGEGTLLVDCQNVINTDFLEDLHGDEEALISTTAVHTLAELVLTILTLPTLLNRLPKTTLVVFGCFSAPFQSSSPAARTVALDRIKNALSRICATNRITVVTTCQCATKLLNSDGSPSNFDSGAQAVMRPAPGPNYMPPGRSSRVILVPNSPRTGHFRLLEPSAADTRRKNKPLEAPYSVKEIMQRER